MSVSLPCLKDHFYESVLDHMMLLRISALGKDYRLTHNTCCFLCKAKSYLAYYMHEIAAAVEELITNSEWIANHKC